MTKLKIEHELKVMSEAVPMEYTVPYDWGRLHVSGDAHSAYGMQPLTADILEGGSLRGYGLNPLNIDIFLLGPNQVPHSPDDDQAGDMYVTSRHLKRGVVVSIGLSNSQTELHTQLGELVAKSITENNNEPDIDITTVTTEDGIPISEVLANNTPQMVAHLIAGVIQEEVSSSVEQWQTDIEARKAYRSISFTGASALVGAGIILAPSFLVSNGVVRPEQLIVPSIYAGVQLNSARAKLKRFVTSQHRRQALSQFSANIIGTVAAESVHHTYCSKHFDATTESLLNDLGT